MKKKIDLQDILQNDKTDKKIKSKKHESAKQELKQTKPEIISKQEKSEPVEQKEPIKAEKKNEVLQEKSEIVDIRRINQNPEKREDTDSVKEFVTFLLKNEEYAIDSDFVRQIIKYKKPLDVGVKSELFFGITNMKDGVLPLVDFRKKFGMKDDRKEEGSIIILQIDDLRVGVYVDYLVGIVRFKESDIKQIPPFLPEKLLSFVSGIGIKEGKIKKIIIILNHLNLFSREDIRELKRIPEMYK